MPAKRVERGRLTLDRRTNKLIATNVAVKTKAFGITDADWSRILNECIDEEVDKIWDKCSKPAMEQFVADNQ